MGPARSEPLWVKSTEEGLEIQVRVVPGARRTGVDGLQEGALKVRLAAPPVDGAANKALVRFVAKSLLGIAKSRVRLVRGERSRIKTLALLGDARDLASRLSASTGLTVPVA